MPLAPRAVMFLHQRTASVERLCLVERNDAVLRGSSSFRRRSHLFANTCMSSPGFCPMWTLPSVGPEVVTRQLQVLHRRNRATWPVRYPSRSAAYARPLARVRHQVTHVHAPDVSGVRARGHVRERDRELPPRRHPGRGSVPAFTEPGNPLQSSNAQSVLCSVQKPHLSTRRRAVRDLPPRPSRR